jgi:hypothetical protein
LFNQGTGGSCDKKVVSVFVPAFRHFTSSLTGQKLAAYWRSGDRDELCRIERPACATSPRFEAALRAGVLPAVCYSSEPPLFIH